jgi:hypothetical protein
VPDGVPVPEDVPGPGATRPGAPEAPGPPGALVPELWPAGFAPSPSRSRNAQPSPNAASAVNSTTAANSSGLRNNGRPAALLAAGRATTASRSVGR